MGRTLTKLYNGILVVRFIIQKHRRSMNLSITRRGLFAIPIPAALIAGTRRSLPYDFHHDNLMGTSLDLTVFADSESQARRAEVAALHEIERLDSILSTYKAATEISRLNASTLATPCSPDLFALLELYHQWSNATGGALSATPNHPEGIVLDRVAQTVTRAANATINLDALGKAYVLDRAAAAALAQSGVSHLMLNIGGDIVFTQGPNEWIAGIANPARPHDNAEPLTRLALKRGAVAASGSYARGAHIIDARSGTPALTGKCATAIAPNAVTANALATALCILAPKDGIALVDATPAAEALITSPGAQFRSAHFAAFERPLFKAVQAASKWTAGYELSINVTLKSPDGGRGFRRPYVAIWAENANGHTVKTIALWVSKPRWIRDLDHWYHSNQDTNWNAVARATRAPGKYRVVWDGLDDNGKAVPIGTYKIFVESNREHGNYALENATIECGSKKSSVTTRDNSEFEAVSIEFGPHVDQA